MRKKRSLCDRIGDVIGVVVWAPLGAALEAMLQGQEAARKRRQDAQERNRAVP